MTFEEMCTLLGSMFPATSSSHVTRGVYQKSVYVRSVIIAEAMNVFVNECNNNQSQVSSGLELFLSKIQKMKCKSNDTNTKAMPIPDQQKKVLRSQ